MKKIFYYAIMAVLLHSFVSCSDNDDNNYEQNDDFDLPELTLTNTIQFTVNASFNRHVSVLLKGGKVAVEWGDGEITKRFEPDRGESWRGNFQHTYKKGGEYRVKIWSDEITFIHLSSLLKDFKDLHVGNCPQLTYAILNSFAYDKTIDINGCKSLETLDLGNWGQLESVALDKCSRLNEAFIYTAPKLFHLDLSKNTELNSFKCSDCPLESILLYKDITNVVCWRTNLVSLTLQDYKNLKTFDFDRNNKLTTVDLTGCDNLNALSLSNTLISSFDFSVFPSLTTINCSNSAMTNIDISKNKNLRDLKCAGLDLTSLDITNNSSLHILNCGDNKLATLDVSKNKILYYLDMYNNDFSKDALNNIFTILPKYDYHITSGYPVAQFFGNPGTETCDPGIITAKGWLVRTK